MKKQSPLNKYYFIYKINSLNGRAIYKDLDFMKDNTYFYFSKKYDRQNIRLYDDDHITGKPTMCKQLFYNQIHPIEIYKRGKKSSTATCFIKNLDSIEVTNDTLVSRKDFICLLKEIQRNSENGLKDVILYNKESTEKIRFSRVWFK